MKKILSIILLPVLLIWVIIENIYYSGDYGLIHRQIKIDIDSGEVVTYVDETNPLAGRGDGIVYASFKFHDQKVEKKIKKHKRWNECPLPDYIDSFFYGDDSYHHGPKKDYEEFHLKDFFPRVENGYYYLYSLKGGDIYTEIFNPDYYYDYEEIVERGYHYVACIYDADNDMLYYFKYRL